MPKFAANLSMMFTELPFLERFDAAAQAGFQHVEFLFPYEYDAQQIKQKLDSNGLQLVLFNTDPGDLSKNEWGLAALPNRQADAKKRIEQALDYALVLNCPHIHVMAGVVPEGEDKSTYKQVFIDNVRYAANLYQPHGIKVMLEALSPKVKPHYLLASQYDTFDIVQQVACDNVFIQFDFFHAQIVDGNLSQLFTNLKDKVGHIQIASVPDRHEPNEGEINYSHIFSLIDASNYSGYVGCEYKPRAQTLAGLAWFDAYK